MNKDNAKDFFPFVKALSEGRTIEIRNSSTDKWTAFPNVSFSLKPHNYRIKPEIKKTEYVIIQVDPTIPSYLFITQEMSYNAEKEK